MKSSVLCDLFATGSLKLTYALIRKLFVGLNVGKTSSKKETQNYGNANILDRCVLKDHRQTIGLKVQNVVIYI